MIMALKGKGKRAVQAAIDSFAPFRHETLRGEWVQDREFIRWGQLPAVYMAMLSDEIAVNGRAFVIFSYSTPIAWRTAQPMIREWFVPDVRYSVTTTNHQNVVRTAADNPGFYADAR
jgi:hypothetical protein